VQRYGVKTKKVKANNLSSFYIKIFYVILSTIILKLTFPPYYLEPLGFIALTPLLFVIKNSHPREASLLGLAFGFTFFTTILWWIIPTISRYGDIPLMCSTAILACFTFYLAIYPAIWAYITSVWIKNKDIPSIVDIINISALWVILEWIRGHILTGFPWAILGCCLIKVPSLIQTASFLGMYWISFIVIFINCLIFVAILFCNKKIYIKFTYYLVISLSIVTCLWAVGRYLIKNCQKSDINYPKLEVVAVQGNIAQGQKWNKNFQNKTFNKYRKLTISALDKLKKTKQQNSLPALIVWPETAMPFFFQDPSNLRIQLLDLAKATHSLILFGAPSYQLNPATIEKKINVSYFNSAFLLSPNGKVLGRYDKQHLVPFGEYLPFGFLTSWARKLIGAIGAFSPGNISTPLCWNNVRVGVLICFESIFPHIAVNFVKNRANLLAIITDDAWFGKTGAPYEHADMAVFRAIETRRYVIRAANTGESLIISPWGKRLKTTKLFTSCWITAQIRLRNDITLYDIIEENWLWPFLLIVLFNLVKFKVCLE